MRFGREENPGSGFDGVRRRDDTRRRPQNARRTFDDERIEGRSNTEHDVVPARSAEACGDHASDRANPNDGDDAHSMT